MRPNLRLTPGLFWTGQEEGIWGLSLSPSSSSVSFTSLYSTVFQKLSLLNPVSCLERHDWVSPEACMPHSPLASSSPGPLLLICRVTQQGGKPRSSTQGPAPYRGGSIFRLRKTQDPQKIESTLDPAGSCSPDRGLLALTCWRELGTCLF